MTLQILCLDDDSIQLEILKEYLGLVDVPYEAAFFSSANKALEYLRSLTPGSFPHVIFVDLFMPRMNGWEFLDALTVLKEERPVHASIYLLSSSVSNRDRSRASDYPILRKFITKPFSLKAFQVLLHHEYDHHLSV